MLIYVVGNKIDNADARQVGTDEGQALAKELEVMFIETSAKAGINVKQLFNEMAMNLPGVKDSSEAIPKQQSHFNLGQPTADKPGEGADKKGKKEKGGCC